MFCKVITKRIILIVWKTTTSHWFKKWLNDRVSCLYLEEITYSSDSQDLRSLPWLYQMANGLGRNSSVCWFMCTLQSGYLFMLPFSNHTHWTSLDCDSMQTTSAHVDTGGSVYRGMQGQLFFFSSFISLSDLSACVGQGLVFCLFFYSN